MTKLLGIISVALLGMASVQAHDMMKKEDMINLAHELEGKTITNPKAMVEKWRDFCAEELTLKAHMLRKMGEQFSPDVALRYKKAAKRFEKLARRVEKLPVPGDVKKTFDMMPQWLSLKAKKMTLKAEQMGIIAKQLNNEMLAKKAKWLAGRAQMMSEVAMELSQPKMMEEMNTECVSGSEYDQA